MEMEVSGVWALVGRLRPGQGQILEERGYFFLEPIPELGWHLVVPDRGPVSSN